MSNRLGTAPVAAGASINVLGGFALTAECGPVAVPATAERLLAYLALVGKPVRRQQLAGALWLESPDDRASASLRSTLWRLPDPVRPLIKAGATHVALADDAHVDLWRAEASIRQVGAAGDLPDEDALGLLDQDVLPGWGDDWVLLERERHRQRRLHALERLCVLHRDSGRFDLALRAGLAAVSGEPLRESAHRRVIEVHLAEGNPGEALRQYELFRRLVRSELGLSPSPAIRSLVAGLLGRPADGGR
ncbi:AfsR/SARP family transcriptional regulator [Motilibacter aurantiacus]|uniref:AfsR/SARP family transcriptional regulator n=1 Tax=Motilibacter aurantiacus TaxID=2714955 RepID=UPI001409BD76|nr:BTAD domain-containing putative transcriptional regulator [Motilibacter aurantiacus]NHC47461.1 SARP family transcriptional regulator [Motilibacter aurantiacus]